MVAFGNRPANFNGAPIEPLPEQPPEHRRNKYGGFGTPITPEIDEKIHRLKIRGLNSREISAELAREDILISWQLVRGRIAFMARGKFKEGPESPVPEAKTPEIQGRPKKEPELSRAATTVNPLQRRIIELDRQKLTPRAISNALEEEGGEVVSNSEIMDVIVKHAKGWFHESPS